MRAESFGSEGIAWNEPRPRSGCCGVKKLMILLATLTILVAACSSGDNDASESGADSDASDVAADGDTDADADAGDAPGSEAESDEAVSTGPVEIDGPKTTFEPPLDGPFNPDGGITFDPDTVEVIVEESPSGPLASTYTAWPTDWTRRTVEDWSEFLAGLQSADPRDGIPPIDTPIFESVSLASEWLSPIEPGALVEVNGETRFYPLSIMTAHEIVNDAFGDVPIAVTYCPLCNTALAFDRRVNGEVLDFGVSGLLRNSDLVMWDRQTTSLWQQITGEGVVGQYAGANLDTLSTSIVSFSQFAENFPDGLSLAAESGRGRASYGSNPYQGYSSSSVPFLFNGESDDRLPALSRVVGVTEGDAIVSYSFERVIAEGVINDEVNGVALVVFGGGETTDALDQRSIKDSQSIGSAIAYIPVVDDQTLTFSANGDDTFTDAETGSTWSITGTAVDGDLAGAQLDTAEHRNEFWFAWQAFFGADNLSEG